MHEWWKWNWKILWAWRETRDEAYLRATHLWDLRHLFSFEKGRAHHSAWPVVLRNQDNRTPLSFRIQGLYSWNHACTKHARPRTHAFQPFLLNTQSGDKKPTLFTPYMQLSSTQIVPYIIATIPSHPISHSPSHVTLFHLSTVKRRIEEGSYENNWVNNLWWSTVYWWYPTLNMDQEGNYPVEQMQSLPCPPILLLLSSLSSIFAK